MPTYEYECSRCGHRWDVLKKMSESDSLELCPECRSSYGKRLVSGGSGLLFRGEGFYHTDYKVGPERRARESAEASTDNEGGGDARTEDP